MGFSDLFHTQGMNTAPIPNPSVPRQQPPRVINRLAALMIHIPWYACYGIAHLSEDSGVAKSAISNLIAGVGQPNYATLIRIADALSRRMGKPLDLRELAITEGMNFPTKYPCDLFGCKCTPPWFFESDEETRKPEFRDIPSGKWTLHGAVHRLDG